MPGRDGRLHAQRDICPRGASRRYSVFDASHDARATYVIRSTSSYIVVFREGSQTFWNGHIYKFKISGLKPRRAV